MKSACSSLLVALCPLVGVSGSSVHLQNCTGTVERVWHVHPGMALEEVRDQVRQYHRTKPGARCRVVLESGRHEGDVPFLLDDKDADTEYLGEDGASVSGSKVISGWREEVDAFGRVWRVTLPGQKDGELAINQLWVNGRRARLARWPKPQKNWKYGTKRLDLLHPADVSQYVSTGGANWVAIDYKKAFKCKIAEQRLTAFSNELDVVRQLATARSVDVSLVVNHNWDVTRRAVRRIVCGVTNVTLVTEGRPFKPWNPWRQTSVYWLENVPGACTEPGECCFDSSAGEITYRPYSGEEIPASILEIPRIGVRQLVKVTGSRNVTFRNLIFEGTDIAEQRQAEPCQAAFTAGAAIQVEKANNVIFKNCTVHGVGEYALWIRDGCADCRVDACHVYDTGAGGVRMGGTNKKSHSLRLSVCDTLIEDVGVFNPCGVGLWIGEPQHSKFLHNHIRRTRYSGVSMGWNWTYEGGGVCNELAYNIVEDVGLGGLTDEGAIYCLGAQYGTAIHDNILRRVDGHTFCRWALYFDQGTSGVTAYNNLCYDAVDGGFSFHYGRDNVVSNNIFATGLANHMINVGRAEKFKMVDFTRNIIWWDARDQYWDVRDKTVAYRDYGCDRAPGSMVFSSNIWWCANGTVLFCGGKTAERKDKEMMMPLTFSEWRRAPFQLTDNDAGSVVEDPLFVDPHKGDFRIQNVELITRMGFVPWDSSQAGIRIGVRPGANRRPVQLERISGGDGSL